MNNPIQTINELRTFMSNYRGNAQQQVTQMIQQSGMNQAELNNLQRKANELYNEFQNMGLIK